jgi:hypothetical protein
MEMKEIINGGQDLLKATQVPDGNGYQLVVVFFTHKGRDYRYSIRREFTHNFGHYIQCASISEREKMYGCGCKRQVKNYQDVSKFEDAVKRIQKMYDAYHNNKAQEI